MENSILTSTKKILGLDEAYEVFDPDIIIFINGAFSTLNQLGIGPDDGFTIEDKTSEWSELSLPEKWLSMVKEYVYLKTKRLFDPASTRYVIAAIDREITEYEWRLSAFREETVTPPPPPPEEIVYVDVFTGQELTGDNW